MPSNHLFLCCPLLLLPSIFLSISVFSYDLALHIRWPTYWSFKFSISPSNEYSGLISFRIDWFDLLAVRGVSRVFPNTTVQKHQFFGAQPSVWSNSHIHTLIQFSSVAQSCLTLLQPHGPQPTRLLCPWNSLGKNTGVDCHSLPQWAAY